MTRKQRSAHIRRAQRTAKGSNSYLLRSLPAFERYLYIPPRDWFRELSGVGLTSAGGQQT